MLGQGRKVCVIGAGTMGGGIAAHLANIGFDVSLLDLTRESARAAFDRTKAARPPHFYLDGTANAVFTGSIVDDIGHVAESDWVCEAVVEKLDVKQALFDRIEPLIRPDALVSTNTSGIQISLLASGRPEPFRRRLIGTHFFNPPRYLKLLELIPTAETDPEVIKRAVEFFEGKVARRVVVAKDTPGFIANRFGMWSMIFTIHVAEKLGLTVEEVDAITGPFLGRPKSGSFRLNDLVGLDIMEDIARNLRERCPQDPEIRHLATPRSMQYLLEKGWIGGKAGQGYYRKEGREFVSFDLRTMAYRQRAEPDLPNLATLERLPLAERLAAGFDQRGQIGEFLREYLVPTLRYATQIREEVSHTARDFDRVMQWGFGWAAGPFEMIDMLGTERVGLAPARFYQGSTVLGDGGKYVTPKPEPDFRVATDFPLLESHDGFNVRDMGDGVVAVASTTKMGVFTPAYVDSLTAYLKSGKPKRIVLTSEAKCFSAGYDLKFFNQAVLAEDFTGIVQAIGHFQALGELLGQIPSVAGVWGYCLGGGFEMAMGCSLIAASAESSIGLPEARVGLCPGGGGVPRMRMRNQGTVKALAEAVRTITLGSLSNNADHARTLGYLTATDVTVYHPDRLLTEAKRLVLTAEPRGANEWAPIAGPLAGMAERALEESRAKGELSEYDLEIGNHVKNIFAKSSGFADALERERHAFLELCREGLTQARIRHMVESGKPLRN